MRRRRAVASGEQTTSAARGAMVVLRVRQIPSMTGCSARGATRGTKYRMPSPQIAPLVVLARPDLGEICGDVIRYFVPRVAPLALHPVIDGICPTPSSAPSAPSAATAASTAGTTGTTGATGITAPVYGVATGLEVANRLMALFELVLARHAEDLGADVLAHLDDGRVGSRVLREHHGVHRAVLGDEFLQVPLERQELGLGAASGVDLRLGGEYHRLAGKFVVPVRTYT